MDPYVVKVIDDASGDRTLVFSDGSTATVVWHGGTVQQETGEKGALMPPYESKSQMSMVREHAKFHDPETPFEEPMTDEQLAALNDAIAESKGWTVAEG